MLTYQTPPQKKKTWLIFLIIGVLATGLLIAGGIAIVSLFNGGSQTKYWNGGYNSPELPNGYTAIVANDYLIVGVGEAYPYYESDGSTTLQIDIYIINKSGNAIYLLFLDNAFDGKMAPYSDVYVSVLRTEAGDTDKGVIYIDSLHDPKDLKKWTGTLKVVDDDTFYDPNPITLDEYFFDLTYRR
ncbi:MAG: hypothetical protein LBU61_05125 [Coriobacteriales bacterium]|jgi:hypothetical protein|nr:hypothetical protein [Coriobacteriales bacterium]